MVGGDSLDGYLRRAGDSLDGASGDFRQLCPYDRHRRHRHGRRDRHNQVVGHHSAGHRSGRPRASWQGVRSERGSLAARHLDEAHSVLYCDCPCSRVPFLLVRCHQHALAGSRGMACGYSNRIPFHDSCGQCNRDCGFQPCVGHDAYDAHHCVGNLRGHRPQRHFRHCGFDGDRRSGLHCAFYGRRLRYRP